MRQRILYLFRFYVLTVLLFAVAKVVFMLCNHSADTFTIADVKDVLWHGLSLDLSTALYLFIPPFLFTIASVWAKMPRWITTAYYWLVAVVLSLAFVADTSLYGFWKFKLDASCLEYLATPTDAMASISVSYLLIRLLVFVLVAFIIYRLYATGSTPQHSSNPLKHKVAETVLYILLIPLIVVGIRGGLDESTTNIGQVYYSPKQFLNHSAVNPMFSFLASLEKSSSHVVEYHFMTDAECRQLTDSLFNTESIDTEQLLTTSRPRNIVIILLESMGGQFTSISGRNDITPRFNQLTHEGIYFSNCFANSWRTDRGTLSTWSGYPSFPTMSVMKMPARSRMLPNLARKLKEEGGYQTHYLYGGDINFTNMRSYLVSGGFDQITWKKDYTSQQQQSAQWGVRDDITFNTLFQLISTDRKTSEPLLVGYSTLSSHEPWDVPVSHFDDEVLNAFYYLDTCIGNFIDRLKKTEAWKQTLVIMLPDHGINYKDIDQRSMLKNHIPMLWLGGVVKAPRVVSQLCNQSDLAATLLGQMDIRHDEFSYSRDVLSTTYRQPFIYHTFRNGFAVADTTGHLIYDLDSNRSIDSQGNNTQYLERLGKALLQKTTGELCEKSVNRK